MNNLQAWIKCKPCFANVSFFQVQVKISLKFLAGIEEIGWLVAASRLPITNECGFFLAAVKVTRLSFPERKNRQNSEVRTKEKRPGILLSRTINQFSFVPQKSRSSGRFSHLIKLWLHCIPKRIGTTVPKKRKTKSLGCVRLSWGKWGEEKETVLSLSASRV